MEKLIKNYINHIKSAFEVECNLYDLRAKSFSNIETCYCKKCPHKCDYVQTHLYGCYESVRWDNKYIYYCPNGYIFIAVPLFDENNMLSHGVITGPILMGNPEDFDNPCGIKLYSTKKVNDICEIVSAMFAPKINLANDESETGEFLNEIYKELEVTSENSTYPVELEKDLRASIVEGDSSTSRDILNKLLGQIFFHSNGNLEIIKARVLELIVILSRGAIDGGANVDQIFNLNNNYISQVKSFDTLEKLSFWLTGIINRFVKYVFDFNDVKHSDTIYKITAYIKSNYMKKISLEDIADHVYMSKTYVSKIFKEEMKISLSSYINSIRIKKSKVLLMDSSLSLADIANIVGFEDQSYYTKIFKNIVGISPGKYREKHGM